MALLLKPINFRSWRIFTAGILMFCLAGAGTTGCATTPSNEERPDPAVQKAPLLLRPAIRIIRRHREMGTHLDGPRCPMYPSCAAFAEKAIRRHSLLGFILSVDRLFFREAGGLDTKYLFAAPHQSRHLRFFDSVEDSMGPSRRPSLLLEEYRPVPRRTR